ncbi:MAG: hypothetical protein NTX25_07425, partial [Proteobacteria bacterium]|nr:hypothetical protein [Pseudomonadota bacterium]
VEQSESKNAPLRIAGASAVWTGKSMIVWGGYKGSADRNRTITDEGSIYDPIADSWTPIMSGRAQGTPSARSGHQAVWIGNKMVVISGGGAASSTDLSSTGGIYDPATDTWSNFQSELMVERVGHKMVWNGEEILLIGGRSNRLKTLFGEVYGFNPLTFRWRVLSGSALPARRVYSSIVWTGSSALVWGGYAGDSKTQRSGSFYYP